HRLHRLDRTERIAGAERPAYLRQLDEDDVAKLLLRVIGDADLCAVSADTDPLVVFRVLHVRRVRHGVTSFCRTAVTRHERPMPARARRWRDRFRGWIARSAHTPCRSPS